jgi:hypothetical protein
MADERASNPPPISRQEAAATASIELSPAQVAWVIASVSGAGNMPWLLSQLENLREPVTELLTSDNPRLSRSLLLGLSLFAAFPADRSSLSITDAARMLAMHASTTHRYIATLLAVGLLEQDPETRRYRLTR